MVNMDIRKSPNGENRFYIHSLNIKKETDLSNSQSELLKDKSISSDSISQINKNVNNKQYSISKDNQGRNLTKGQQEYFRNTKLNDTPFLDYCSTY